MSWQWTAFMIAALACFTALILTPMVLTQRQRECEHEQAMLAQQQDYERGQKARLN